MYVGITKGQQPAFGLSKYQISIALNALSVYCIKSNKYNCVINTELLQNAMLFLHLFIDVSMMIKNYVLQSQKQM